MSKEPLPTKKIENGGTPPNNQTNSKPFYKRPFVIAGIFVFILILATLCFFIGGFTASSVQFFITSVLSFLVLIIIAAQADIYQRQWKSMQESLAKTQNLIDQSERAMKYAQAAYLHVETVKMTRCEIGQTSEVRIRIMNSGNTPAYNVKIFAYVAPQHKGFSFTRKEALELRPANSTFDLGGNKSRFESVHESGGALTAEGLRNAEIPIYAWGIVTYKDIFRRKRWTEFCHFRRDGFDVFFAAPNNNRADRAK